MIFFFRKEFFSLHSYQQSATIDLSDLSEKNKP